MYIVCACTSEQTRAMAMVCAHTKQTEQTSEQTLELYTDGTSSVTV